MAYRLMASGSPCVVPSDDLSSCPPTMNNNNNNNNNDNNNNAGYLEQLGIKNRTRTMQKSALLGSAHIFTKVLEV